MIHKLLGGDATTSLNGTAVLDAIALMKGASILRVHDVKEALKANQPHDHYILIKGSNSVKLFQLPVSI